jgi:hypothetical protein
MQWPYEWMIASFVAAIIGIVLPWLTGGYKAVTAMLSAAITLFCVFNYERALEDFAQEKVNLIRVELPLLLILLAVNTLSCFLALFVGLAELNKRYSNFND